jgi:hypothetical protein
VKHIRQRIRKIWDSRKNPLKKLWRWARSPDKLARVMQRWKALKEWARGHADQARKAGDQKKRKWWLKRQKDSDAMYDEFRKRFVNSHDDPTPQPAHGVVTPDRPWNPNHKPVAAWMVPWLDKYRANGWVGIVVSGYRSPEYCEQPCISMCGHTSCPGTCAGRSSNHTGVEYPRGAIDVTDFYNFAAIGHRINSPLWNNLPSDRVHFSTTGN